jgi:hypothetical protein
MKFTLPATDVAADALETGMAMAVTVSAAIRSRRARHLPANGECM